MGQQRPLRFHWDLTRLIRSEKPSTYLMRFKSDTDDAIISRIFGETYVAFDGTNTVREWLENVMTMKDEKYDVAYGFMNAVKEFYANMSQFLDGGAINTIVGHSRGGAIAQAFAMMARNDGYRVRVVSFGSPRVGGKEFCRLMRGIKHTRVILSGDPVPLLPLPMRFRHYETKLVELKQPEGVWRPSKIHQSYGGVL